MLTLAGVFLFPLNLALAHDGGTDSHGCHRNSRTDEYHCHNRKDGEEKVDWAVVGGVTGGVLLP